MVLRHFREADTVIPAPSVRVHDTQRKRECRSTVVHDWNRRDPADSVAVPAWSYDGKGSHVPMGSGAFPSIRRGARHAPIPRLVVRSPEWFSSGSKNWCNERMAEIRWSEIRMDGETPLDGSTWRASGSVMLDGR